MRQKKFPGHDLPTTAQDEAWRLKKAFRTFRVGSTGGRAIENEFARRLRGALRYRQRWVNLTYNNVCENAWNGCCSEVPGAGVVLPWEPETPYQWHPNLMPSLRQKMVQDGVFNQAELDMKFALAASVRILLEEWGITDIGDANTQWKKVQRTQLIHDLFEAIEQRVGTAVAHYAYQEQQTQRFFTAKQLPEDMRKGAELMLGMATQGGSSSSAGPAPSGRTSSGSGKKQPAQGDWQWAEWYPSSSATWWQPEDDASWHSPSGEQSQSSTWQPQTEEQSQTQWEAQVQDEYLEQAREDGFFYGEQSD